MTFESDSQQTKFNCLLFIIMQIKAELHAGYNKILITYSAKQYRNKRKLSILQRFIKPYN